MDGFWFFEVRQKKRADQHASNEQKNPFKTLLNQFYSEVSEKTCLQHVDVDDYCSCSRQVDNRCDAPLA